MQRTTTTLSRRERKELTRRRLVEGVLDIARHDGLAAVSTRRLADAAGIQQPSFYGHYACLDDCIRDATEEVADRIRRVIRERRREIAQGAPSEALRAAYVATVDAFLEHRELSEILLRYRRDKSPLGELIRASLDTSRRELIEDMRNLGLTEELVPHLEIHAELILASSLACVEGLLDGRFDSRDAVVEVLAHTTLSSLMALTQGAMHGS